MPNTMTFIPHKLRSDSEQARLMLRSRQGPGRQCANMLVWAVHRGSREKRIKPLESIAVDQVVDHMVTLMQIQQVGFRVSDVAEAMIGVVRRLLMDGNNRTLMQGDTSNAYGSTDSLLFSEQ